MVEDMSARLIQGTIRRGSRVRISGGSPLNYKGRDKCETPQYQPGSRFP